MRCDHVAFGPDRMPSPFVAAAAWCAAFVLGGVVASGAPPAPVRPTQPANRPRPVVDSAVVPAGGAACRHCPGVDCPLHGGHLAGCRDGLCAPHCPVRPVEYGFYRTQWRRWPGQGVTPVSAEQAATPVSPPASLAPSADEESPLPPPGEAPAAEPSAAGGDAVAPSVPAPRAEEADETNQPESQDRSQATPIPDGAATGQPAGMRYPEQVGRSLAAGVTPWRLRPTGLQRPADSARGL